jgi:hypothetical protein
MLKNGCPAEKLGVAALFLHECQMPFVGSTIVLCKIPKCSMVVDKLFLKDFIGEYEA